MPGSAVNVREDQPARVMQEISQERREQPRPLHSGNSPHLSESEGPAERDEVYEAAQGAVVTYGERPPVTRLPAQELPSVSPVIPTLASALQMAPNSAAALIYPEINLPLLGTLFDSDDQGFEAIHATQDIPADHELQVAAREVEAASPIWTWGYTPSNAATASDLAIREIGSVHLTPDQVPAYIQRQLQRWSEALPGLQPLMDPAYPPMVNREKMDRWVAVATRLDAHLAARIRSEEGSWLGALRIRHGCLPIVSDMSIFDVPIESLPPAQEVALLQTALMEAGYEFANVAPDWNRLPFMVMFTSEMISSEVAQLFQMLHEMMEVWRDAARRLPCSFPSHEHPFAHVENVEDVEMMEVDAEGDILMLEGAREHLTADVIVRLRSVRQRPPSSSASSGSLRQPPKRSKLTNPNNSSPPPAGSCEMVSSSSGAESMETESKGESLDQCSSIRSSDQNMSDASSNDSAPTPQGVMVMSAQAAPAVFMDPIGAIATIDIRDVPSSAVNPPRSTATAPPFPVNSPVSEDTLQQDRAPPVLAQGEDGEPTLSVTELQQMVEALQTGYADALDKEREKNTREQAQREAMVRERVDSVYQVQFQEQEQAHEEQLESERRRLNREAQAMADRVAREHSEEQRRRQEQLEVQKQLLRRQQVEIQRQADANQKLQEKERAQQTRRMQQPQSARSAEMLQAEIAAERARWNKERQLLIQEVAKQKAQVQVTQQHNARLQAELKMSATSYTVEKQRAELAHQEALRAQQLVMEQRFSNYQAQIRVLESQLHAAKNAAAAARSTAMASVPTSRPEMKYNAVKQESAPTSQSYFAAEMNFSDFGNGFSGSRTPTSNQLTSDNESSGMPLRVGWGDPPPSGPPPPPEPPEPPRNTLTRKTEAPTEMKAATQVVNVKMMMPYNAIPPFDGSEDLEDRKQWWIQYTYSAEACSWSPEEKCKQIARWFRGSARAWYSQLDRSTQLSWKLLSREFVEQFCKASDTHMEHYLALTQRYHEKPLQFLWRLNAAAAKAGENVSSKETRARHIKRFLQKVTDKTVKLNLAGRRFDSMQEFAEALKWLQEVTQAEDESEIDDLFRNDSRKSVQFAEPKVQHGRYRPHEKSHERPQAKVHYTEGCWDQEDEQENTLTRENVEEDTVYAAQGQPQGHRYGSARVIRPPNAREQYVAPKNYARSALADTQRFPCGSCGKTNHRTEDCWQGLICDQCGGSDHPAEHCFQKLLPCSLCTEKHVAGRCAKLTELYALLQQVKNAPRDSPTPKVPPSPLKPNESPSSN